MLKITHIIKNVIMFNNIFSTTNIVICEKFVVKNFHHKNNLIFSTFVEKIIKNPQKR